MDSRYNGVAILTGDSVLLGRLNELVERIEACAQDSSFGRDKNWVAHLFTSVVTDKNIFCDGGDYVGEVDELRSGRLKLAIHATTDDARSFMQDLSSHLGVSVVWIYTDNYSGKERACSFTPVRSSDRWELRSLKPTANVEISSGTDSTLVDISHIEAGLSELVKRVAGHTTNVGCLDCAVYHCALAIDGIASYSAEEIPILKDRICADALIAGEAVVHLSSELFVYHGLKEVTTLMQKTAELTTVLRNAYETDASSLHYMDRLAKPVSYHTVYSVLSNVRKLLSMLQRGELYTNIVFKQLPRKLW